MLLCFPVKPSPEQSASATARIVSAANTFPLALDPKQRIAVLYSFDDEQQRKGGRIFLPDSFHAGAILGFQAVDQFLGTYVKVEGY